jgi:DeoR family transcriptional regulator, aga operon transcriptional repressor
MKARRAAIIDMLPNMPRLSIRDLAKDFDVSEMTIRRDLDFLESKGLLVRSRGGGVAVGSLTCAALAVLKMSFSPEKIAIGKLAAGLANEGQTIMLDSGSTSLQIALNLPTDKKLTVATTSLLTAKVLYDKGIPALMLGGNIVGKLPSVCGPMTERQIHDLHIDLLFTGCEAASSTDGFYLEEIWDCSLWQAMMSIAATKVVVGESVKFSSRALIRFALPSEVHILVTDSGISAEDVANLERAGVKVLIASPESNS